MCVCVCVCVCACVCACVSGSNFQAHNIHQHIPCTNLILRPNHKALGMSLPTWLSPLGEESIAQGKSPHESSAALFFHCLESDSDRTAPLDVSVCIEVYLCKELLLKLKVCSS